MARKNRLVVEDGLYHLTTRIAHQEHLLSDPTIKDKIVGWIYDIADFSGVNVCAWNVMDNHLHLYVHVPPVPEKYWLTPPEAGTVPPEAGTRADADPATSAVKMGTAFGGLRLFPLRFNPGVGLSASARVPVPSAFSMRPPENRMPRWLPDEPVLISPAGDRPSPEAIRRSIADSVPVVTMPQVPTRFTLSDEEMLSRLHSLYADNPKRVEDIAERWARARVRGAHESVEREKDTYCRRMYNVSQYMKTLKQRISEYFNRELDHEGQLWDGRFYSALVDKDDDKAKLCVLAYIELNSYRTKKKIKPQDWKWCSFHTATQGGDSPRAKGIKNGDSPRLDSGNGGRLERYAKKARDGYERLFGTDWKEVVRRLESVFEAEVTDEEEQGACPKTMIGLVHSHCRMLERGGFISRSIAFAEKALAAFPPKFPTASKRSINFFMAINWSVAA